MIEIGEINYSCLIDNYKDFIAYAFKTNTEFSMMTYLKRPYSKRPPNCDHDDILSGLKPYLIDQRVGIRKWSNSGASNNHMVMNIYTCCRDAKAALLELPNMFLPIDQDLPEDICFYRKKATWLATVSHEKLAFLYDVKKEDYKFMDEKGIDYFLYHPDQFYSNYWFRL